MLQKIALRIIYMSISLSLIYMTSAEADLRKFLLSLKSLQARFVQIETNKVTQDEKISYGTISIKSPSYMRWENEELTEVLVADGRVLHIYDAELKQVSRYNQNEVLRNTPAILLSNPQDFKKNFRIEKIRKGEQGTWYELVPRKKNSLYDFLEVYMEDNSLITQMNILNNVENSLTKIELYYEADDLNQPLNSSLFKFKVPAGADILDL